MEKQMRALIAGATGLVGGELLKRLASNPGYETVNLLLRRPLNMDHERVSEHIVDFEDLQIPDLQADQVFCALGTTMKKAGSKEAFRKVDYHYVMNLGRLAKKMEAHFFLVSSLGADPQSSNFYLNVKGQVEKDLEALKLKSLNIFRPSLMHDGRKERRPGEAAMNVAAKLIGPLLWGPLKKYRVVSGAQVAQAMVNVAAQVQEGTHVFESDGFHRFPPQT